ncbi:hypothetical protein GOBAR_AA28538 [Gossypium barbadense]|uniref:Proline dehydrogenase n=1 Tax=Gossypium barbadense TaxID=3634 RepID=A0A2P5WM45_GOSBA|nr:hypothetical protein GOBAR_AA28538 [Gossypium barbadense]
MATKFLSPKLLNTFPSFTRFLNSASTASLAAVAPLNFDEKPEPAAVEKQPTSLKQESITNATLDLDDHQRLFGSIPTLNLLRSAANLGLAANERFVDFGMWIMNSRLMETSLVRDAILKTVKHTFFQHFCAGETTEEAADCVRRIHDKGFRGMLVYAVEHTSDNAGCDRNLEGSLGSVELAKSLPASSPYVRMYAYKQSCDTGALDCQQNFSKLLTDHDLTSLSPKSTDSSALYHTLEKPAPLSPKEESDLQLAHQRLLKLCQKCVQDNVALTIDAEDTSIQPAIDYFTYSSAIMYNQDDNPIVFGTIQAYLKDAKERLFMTTKTAQSLGIPMGFKLVRGAYMSSESKLASLLGYDSPIHNSIRETHACYNDCASFMLERIADGYGAVVLATHNVESGQLAASKACDLGIQKGNQKLEFAQLYGMSEALSFGLRNAGFQVSKYLPYGPVDMVMPYLLRRAEENRGLLSTSSLDSVLMGKELKRRLKKLQFAKSAMASPSSMKIEIGTH